MKIELGKDLEKASLPALAVFTFEEDAGKSMHDEAAGKGDTRIDLNRTGTPLLEVVSEPDMRSPEEARAYLTELKLLLTYLGVSDCNMEQGSLRVDANVNLHVHTDDGKIATPIVEVKNMNSFRAVERALVFEVEQQRAFVAVQVLGVGAREQVGSSRRAHADHFGAEVRQLAHTGGAGPGQSQVEDPDAVEGAHAGSVSGACAHGVGDA